ncbi:MAG: DUF1232 domain-containing protein [Anaerolineae bacterium]|jgi:uncharacterized membrane protein YkvA (DUF1232 family)|nr:DUF1232 domain-containing protein [Anaerolineae bacterium]MBT7073681.1 DUF1232 domain-containing protein [Anaerolineae bacterium]MBT7783558.1 DUF1232 domain-containing protein [Anaerolineae bacterium]
MKDHNSKENSSPTQDSNFFKSMSLQVKLIMRLMGDSRVSSLAKLLPLGSLIYLISPVDFIPAAVMPIIGAADDVAIMWFGLNFFIDLCPAHVVAEHRAQLGVGPANDIVDGEIIDD